MFLIQILDQSSDILDASREFDLFMSIKLICISKLICTRTTLHFNAQHFICDKMSINLENKVSVLD